MPDAQSKVAAIACQAIAQPDFPINKVGAASDGTLLFVAHRSAS
jgi:hypothetical protein